jgi:hypothetical protein
LPTVLRHLGYRFFFYSNEGTEPPHIHVEKDENEAKFWLNPIDLAYCYGFGKKDLNRINDMVVENQQIFQDAWNEHFR